MNSSAHILIVEDESIVAFNLQQRLSHMGYHVPDIAASGCETLHLLSNSSPDLILMDIHIEGEMDGIEVAARIQETSSVPVIYLTAYSEDATLERARLTKPYGYLLKPFSERELHATIQMALERHVVAEALVKSQQLLQQALDAAQMGTVEIDCAASHISLSQQSASLIGKDEEKAITFAEFLLAVEEADRPAIAAHLDTTKAQLVRFSEEFRVRYGAEGENWVKIDVSPQPGRRFSGIVQNITTRKRAEIQTLQLNDSLERQVNERTQELEQSVRELEAFSYSAAHDLRAPIRAIAGLSNVMIEDYAQLLDSTGVKLLKNMGSSAARMGDLIDALLEMSRLSRSTMQLCEVDISQIANELAGSLMASEAQRRAEITVNPGMTAIADPTLVRCVLDNLMRNAWKFSAKKQKTCIEVNCFLQNDEPVFYVRDEGCGFDMQFAERLFAPFNRLHNQTEFSGSGIGLSIVRRVVSRHGGRVWVNSTPNVGSTFFFTLRA